MNKSKVIYTAYVPHGINPIIFYPIEETSRDYEEYIKFREDFLKKNDFDFFIFWNNRNIRRKQPGDVMLAFKTFCDSLPKNLSKRVALFMHTQVVDPNGTDLLAVKEVICPEHYVIFSNQKVTPSQMNFYYNISDVTVNIASNEGFGLSGAESLMTGTPIINNVTGGLQDQCRFENEKGEWINFDSEFTSNHRGKYKKHGEWAKPIFPSNISLQGSVPTPYIFDDRADYRDLAEALRYWYDKSPEERKEAGLKGREWVLSEECGMSSEKMCNSFKKHIDFLLNNWEKPERFTLEEVRPETVPPLKNIGITD